MSDYVEGVSCPRCGDDHDTLMDRPALKEIGWNPKSGQLYRCGSCTSRVTEFEIETGNDLDVLIDGDCDWEPEGYNG